VNRLKLDLEGLNQLAFCPELRTEEALDALEHDLKELHLRRMTFMGFAAITGIVMVVVSFCQLWWATSLLTLQGVIFIWVADHYNYKSTRYAAFIRLFIRRREVP
jgi:hypothetical protein